MALVFIPFLDQVNIPSSVIVPKLYEVKEYWQTPNPEKSQDTIVKFVPLSRGVHFALKGFNVT